MCKPAEAYGKQLATNILILLSRLTVWFNFCSIIYIDLLVALQYACGSGCANYVAEESGTLTVCAEILFINGTFETATEYTVLISAADDPIRGTSSAQSKLS